MADRPESLDDLAQVVGPEQPLLHARAEQRAHVVGPLDAAGTIDDRSRQAQLRRLRRRMDVESAEQARACDVDVFQVRERTGRGDEQLRARRRGHVQPAPPGRRQSGEHHSRRRAQDGDPHLLLDRERAVVADDHLPVPPPQPGLDTASDHA